MNMERSEGTRKQANANKQNDKKSLRYEVRRKGSDDGENGRAHLIKMISTAWRKSSQVLYSRGSSCSGRMSSCGEREGTWNSGARRKNSLSPSYPRVVCESMLASPAYGTHRATRVSAPS